MTIPLLDPPLHKFLPHTEAEIVAVAKVMGVSAEKLRARAADLHESNPMLDFRGVRIAIRYPEVAEIQARAIFEGSIEAGEADVAVTHETGTMIELSRAALRAREIAAERARARHLGEAALRFV